MMPTISNWMVCQRFGGVSLMGKIEGHPDPEVGIKPMSVTSIVLGKHEGRVVTASGTQYCLGEPYKGLEEACEAFINSLPELEV